MSSGIEPRSAPRPTRLGCFRLGTELRTTGAGTWFLAYSANERPSGAMRVAPGTDLGSLVAGTRRLHALDSPGVVGIHDLVQQADHVWLITPAVPGPTLADLTGSGANHGAWAAARLAAEVGLTIFALHNDGLVHGRVEPSSVLLRSDGVPLLADWAAAGTVEGDVRGWAGLIWLLARSWCADDIAGGAMLAGAALAASRGELADALDDLHRILGRYAASDSLDGAADRWLAAVQPPPAAESVAPAEPPEVPSHGPRVEPAATLLGERRATAERARASADPTVVAPRSAGSISFGPGVRPSTVTSWPVPPRPPGRARGGTRRLLRAILSIVLTSALMLLALAVFLALQR